MKNLEKLTLVMPTFERQEYALRNMKYWSNMGPRVLVLDGSLNPIDSNLLKNLGVNIIYKHQNISIVDRLKYVLDEVDTPYVAMICDDEFYIKTSLSDCVDELTLDQELVSCIGCCLGYIHHKGAVVGLTTYPNLKGYQVTQSEGGDRLIYHMSHYIPSTVYGVTVSSVWKKAIYSYVSREFPVYAIGELQIEMLISFAGKSKVIPKLMWLRARGGAAPIRGTNPSLNESFGFENWWSNSEYADSRSDFINEMALHLA